MEMEKVIWIAFVRALAILVGIGGLSIYNTRELVDAAGLVSHTFEVLGQLKETYGDLRDTESARRGYAITRLPVHRQIFDKANREGGSGRGISDFRPPRTL